jgi:hypothetical protein
MASTSIPDLFWLENQGGQGVKQAFNASSTVFPKSLYMILGYTRVLYSLYARGINPNRLFVLPFVAVIPLLLFLFTT